MAEKSTSLFKQLTRLFRSGPVVKRKIKTVDTTIAMPDNTKSSGTLLFSRSSNSTYSSITSNAYNLSERLARYQDFNEMEYTPELASALDIYCLASDTVVPMLDGTKLTVKELYESNRENFNIYSYDIENNKFVPGLCTKVLKTGTNQQIFKVGLDDGTYLRLTENHRVLLSDGTYKRVKDLLVNDKVRSLYTRISSTVSGDRLDGYEQIMSPDGTWKYTHRIVAENTEQNKKGVVHHVDINKRNNDPNNLQFMSWPAHQTLHASLNPTRWKTNPAYALKMKKLFSEHAKKMHSIPGWTKSFIAKRNEVFASYDENTKKRLFGRNGEQNGMFNQGQKISGMKNGRWNKKFVRSVAKADLVKLILSGTKLADVCKTLSIRHCDLSKSMKSFGIAKWSKRALFDAIDLNTEITTKLKAFLKSAPENVNLNRQLLNACKKLAISRDTAYLALNKSGYANWGEFVSGTNHIIKSVVPDSTDDVFDLTVPKYHNFAISGNSNTDSYVIVHNSDEAVAQDDKGRILHIYSGNEKIKQILEELFLDTLNIDFNLRSWVRNLVKYGDMFLYNDVHPEHGVINAFPIPANEIEREENFDPDDPFAIRYRWVSLGNKVLENWEVSHFRLLGNDMFLPYGNSVIEPARRIWRQLILIEDAMLVYRVVRAPERRVFYIDVANIPAEDVAHYMEEQRKVLRSNQVIDSETSRVDMRYNPMPIHKDSPVPLLDGTTMSIESISKRMKAEPDWTPWVYSVQDKTHKMIPGKVSWCDKNYTAKKLVKVWLDNGSYVLTAPEHPFILRDGSKKRADELNVSDSLMPLYRKDTTKGYETVYDPASEEYIKTHRVVAKSVNPELWESTEHRTVHHAHPEIENNKKNNSPENLEIMSICDHRKWHSERLECTLHRPDAVETNRQRLIEWSKSDRKKATVGDRYSRAKLNHFVSKVEHIDVTGEDVYCMTVVGPNGEDDRHNFAVCGLKPGSNNCTSVQVDGIIIQNSVDEDFHIPVRGGETGTRIDTLQAGQNTGTVEDVAYIQKKLFAALKIPKAYLGYEEDLSCVVPETSVALLDGRSLTVEQIRGELDEGKSIWVYSVDPETHKLVPGEVELSTPTRANAELVRVTLDNGSTFDCTPDHKWMTRDGSWIEAGDMISGSSLMPLYRRQKSMHGASDYEQVYDPATNAWEWTHKLIADRVEGGVRQHESITESCRKVIHHVDFDRLNNSPENLIQIESNAHLKLHQNNLDNVRKQTSACGGYSGMNNGWAKKCRQKVAHLMNITTLIDWCKNNKVHNRREITSNYGLPGTQFNRLLDENNLTYKEFSETHLGGYKLMRKGTTGSKFPNYYRSGTYAAWCKDNNLPTVVTVNCKTCNKELITNRRKPKVFCDGTCFTKHGRGRLPQKNHTVVSVVPLEERRQTWCLTVKKWHNFALTDGTIIANSKATLAQMDIRFARTINVIQKTMLAELNKLAVIHLYAHGYSDDDLVEFELKLSNPSTIAQQQKLELWRAKFDIASAVPEGMGSKQFVYENIWELSEDEVDKINEQRMRDKMIDATIENVEGEGGDIGSGGGGGGGDPFGGGNDGGGDFGDDNADFDLDADDGGGSGDEDIFDDEEEPPEENASEIPDEEEDGSIDLLVSSDDKFDDEVFDIPSSNVDKPVKVSPYTKRTQYNYSRRRTHGASKTHMPDLLSMVDGSDREDTMNDPFDKNYLKSITSNPLGESRTERSPRRSINKSTAAILRSFKNKYGKKTSSNAPNGVLSESRTSAFDIQDEIDLLNEEKNVNLNHLNNDDLGNTVDDELIIIEHEDLIDNGSEK